MFDEPLDEAPEGATQNDVTFTLAIAGVVGELFVREVALVEPMNGLPVATVHAHSEGAPPSSRDLLRKNCTVKVQRPGYLRHFHGIVWQARVHDVIEGMSSPSVSPAPPTSSTRSSIRTCTRVRACRRS